MHSQQPSLFQSDLEQYVTRLLTGGHQPSAEELVQICVNEFGEWVKADLKEAVLNLLESRNLTSQNKAYLSHLIEERTLDKAMASPSDGHERRAIETGIDQLVQAGIEYRQSESLKEIVSFMAKFRDYAPYNNMLVRIQNPSCGFYATATDWKRRFDRTLKEDARPMLILAPMHPVMLVYDVDQTEGKALPESYDQFAQFDGEWDSKWLENLTKNALRHKIRVDYKPLSSSNAGFATFARTDSGWKMRIAIHEALDEPSRFGVLCHEIGHILLGHLGGDQDLWWPSRVNLDHHSMEVEAEATAYIVTEQLGLNGSSAAYVSAHLKDGEKLPNGVSLDNIAKVAGKVGQMAKGLMPEPKPKKQKQGANA
ncbi:MAG: ImmA/IrrE family metallo-endopeptidase [Candidatus Thiodiazotropha taylori]|nr:ImmA/IrrE family metallo-endopeptidase [Candidatus Thiodiazotropha taylori]MCG8112733.1 ImmA/IrrE family metallo-endopeptidase [Candidatus Thiodiazotropha taylori]MCW4226265.1 ImmA/IrrE family metallo-endopeptidase [Candidatus Thiodiazotropha endolucinida]MCW4285091.1 ImmA/IrrE family metallo-endopeptidase [Candidatus Thiodiazotropha taylori]